MQQTLLLVLFTSAWTLGLYFATYEGQILHGPKLWCEKVLGEYWAKPVLGCPYCMPSIHGLLICAAFHGKHWDYCVHPWQWLLLQWAFVCVAASALNNPLFNLIEVLRGYAGLFEQPAEPEPKKQKRRRTK